MHAYIYNKYTCIHIWTVRNFPEWILGNFMNFALDFFSVFIIFSLRYVPYYYHWQCHQVWPVMSFSLIFYPIRIHGQNKIPFIFTSYVVRHVPSSSKTHTNGNLECCRPRRHHVCTIIIVVQCVSSGHCDGKR